MPMISPFIRLFSPRKTRSKIRRFWGCHRVVFAYYVYLNAHCAITVQKTMVTGKNAKSGRNWGTISTALFCLQEGWTMLIQIQTKQTLYLLRFRLPEKKSLPEVGAPIKTLVTTRRLTLCRNVGIWVVWNKIWLPTFLVIYPFLTTHKMAQIQGYRNFLSKKEPKSQLFICIP